MPRPQRTTSSETLDNYYDVCLMLNDNIKLVSALIYIQGADVRISARKIESDLMNLRVDKYSQELDSILDLKIDTLHNLQKLCLVSSLSEK
jgi:hypothetical protein